MPISSIFELPHIFIVFNYGAGGNFLAGICNSLINKNLQSLTVAKDGSSHSLVSNKAQGIDFLSFGTLVEEHNYFESEKAREDFYLEKIKTEYTHIDRPQIIWSHDYTNIPLYRKYFKNCRILVITNNSVNEQITSVIMNINKTLLGTDAAIPLTDKLWKFVLDKWKAGCFNILCDFLDRDRATKIIQNRLDKENKIFLEYASIRLFLKYYGLLHHVDVQDKHTISVYDYVLYPLIKSNPPYKKGNTLNSYIDDKCVVLPYNYLIDNNVDLLIERLSSLLVTTLSPEENTFIREEFSRYRNSQNQLLLADPVAYYKKLKESILNR